MSSDDSSTVLGIDLGTTFSAMAVVNNYGKPEIITNAEGFATTPSVVHFYDNDACVVGEEAVKMVVIDPESLDRVVGEADAKVRELFAPNFTAANGTGLYTNEELWDYSDPAGDALPRFEVRRSFARSAGDAAASAGAGDANRAFSTVGRPVGCLLGAAAIDDGDGLAAAHDEQRRAGPCGGE